MCGILGVISKSNIDIQTAVKALSEIRHRGPDDEGILLANNNNGFIQACHGSETIAELKDTLPHWDKISSQVTSFLGHRRLSILDLSLAGHQPMAFEDDRYWITYNGEIYNYIELRDELISLGVNFRSNSDTEVILAAYSKWGSQCVERFRGMWSFGIWDRRTGIIFLSRDHFGIKPLYYSFNGETFAFCSEVKGLLSLNWVSRNINPQKCYEYLLNGRVENSNGETMLKEIHELPAAHNLEIQISNLAICEPRKYWSPKVRNCSVKSEFSESCINLRNAFQKSISLHMRSDVAVGAALSGGIDSSTIVAAVREYCGHTAKIHTFSFVSKDAELSEERWIDLAAKASRTIVYKTTPDSEELRNDLDELIKCQDFPFANTSIYAQYRVFKLVRDSGIKVTLDGQGPDEMFAGYSSFRKDYAVSLFASYRFSDAFRMSKISGIDPVKTLILSFIPLRIVNFLKKITRKVVIPPWLSSNWHGNECIVNAYAGSNLPQKNRLKHSLSCSTTVSSIPTLLRYEDRNSMHFSVESRLPYLIPELFEMSQNLPDDFLISRDGVSKYILRNAFRGLTHQSILDRADKKGFSTPEAEWIIDNADLFTNTFTISNLLNYKMLNAHWVHGFSVDVLDKKIPYDPLLWRIFNFIKWLDNLNKKNNAG